MKQTNGQSGLFRAPMLYSAALTDCQVLSAEIQKIVHANSHVNEKIHAWSSLYR